MPPQSVASSTPARAGGLLSANTLLPDRNFGRLPSAERPAWSLSPIQVIVDLRPPQPHPNENEQSREWRRPDTSFGRPQRRRQHPRQLRGEKGRGAPRP
eukprot:966158-Pyramimonas_sp.AAC.1